MTSATEVLRRMLDERGVEWWEDAFSGEHRTVFDGKDGVRYCVYQLGSSLFISSILPVTPEQAIAATLGSCNCSDNCTNSERTGTCHNVWDVELTGRLRFQCSECGGVSLEITPNFCPVCGRKVVEPTTNDVDAEVSDD